ncbi:helix-turn-helix domain-containing protein [Cohnella zeiphila]|uniref:Helix-turn-helix transcriptional regulator n=1 Tax=Cohnella zeiphila TaxID=2761120 RepID=A0A7X0VUD1_9BACL|nr:AraC family transcriptional regulator [Cohnella zeiphila]MBB6730884.1 helix-turn-helix transcriptional regulator [Cohnella zeiphila]
MYSILPVHDRNLSPYIRYAHELDLTKGYLLLNRIIYDHEFVFGISGRAFVTMGGATHAVGPGDLLLIKPHVPHTMKVVDETPFRSVCVHFDWTDLGPASDFSPIGVYLNVKHASISKAAAKELEARPADEFAEFAWPAHLTVSESLPFLSSFREVVKHFREARLGSKLHMKAAFLRIIAMAADELTTDEGIPKGYPHADLVREAMRTIRQRYREPIVHEELAAQSGLSPKYFGKLFKGAIGRTITEYLLDIRMERAKELLAATASPLKEIAASVGIDDVYYFSKLFKRIEGMPPGQYRKTMRR